MASPQVFVIPSGKRIFIPAILPSDLGSLRTWLAQETGIPIDNQLLLNLEGKIINDDKYLTDHTIYLYDQDFYSSSSASGLSHVPLGFLPEPYKPDPFPTSPTDKSSVHSWRDLFTQRLDWVNNVFANCQSIQSLAEEYIDQRTVLEEGVRVASLSVKSPINDLEKRINDISINMKTTNSDTENKIATLETDLARLQHVPALSSFARFFIKATGKRSGTRKTLTTLNTFIDETSVRTATEEARTMFADFSAKAHKYDTGLKHLVAQIDELKNGMIVTQSHSSLEDLQSPAKLVDEVQIVVNKISTDTKTIMNYRNDPKSITSTIQMADKHSKYYLPDLQLYSQDMNSILDYAAEQKKNTLIRTASLLQMISSIGEDQNILTKNVKALKMTDQHWAIVDRIMLPSTILMIYPALLTESIRRHEWVTKMKQDSSSLQEEIAGYKEEEQKRRKKWREGMETIIPSDYDDDTKGVEIDLHGGTEELWPEVTRKELNDYIQALQILEGPEEALQIIAEDVANTDKPTGQQVKRAKAFKNGSVHEANFGKASLSLRGDETKVLKEMINKLEDEQKSSKSVIRRLEAILHGKFAAIHSAHSESTTPVQPVQSTQSAQQRPSSAALVRDTESRRRGSSSSRRYSSTHMTDDKISARRIVQLEAEIMEEKRHRERLEKELEDANLTKEDIRSNFKAREDEFSEERRSLESASTKLKEEKEALEEEIDNLLKDQDVERDAIGEITQLKLDFDKLRKQHANEIRRVENRLQEQSRSQREQLEIGWKEYFSGLIDVLAPGFTVPETVTEMMSRLDELVQAAAQTAQTSSREISSARSESHNLRSSLELLQESLNSLTSTLEAREAELMKVKGDLQTETSKADSNTKLLEQERKFSEELREKFADGETGSEALRRQLTEKDSEMSRILSKLAETNSHNNTLDVELLATQSKYKKSQAQVRTLQTHAQEVTKRLYNQNNTLLLLLQDLRFVVAVKNGKMVVDRASKVNANSITVDQSASQSASLSQNKKAAEAVLDLSCLLWMEKTSPTDEETKFKEYIDNLDRLPLESFCEEMAKRMKNIEHTARKYQSEAKAVKEKVRKAFSNSHDKIAFRSFKAGDLALFLPTKKGSSWAAFNVGAPHYFLREQENHRLTHKEWLVARITNIDERAVDLSRALAASTKASDGQSLSGKAASESGISIDDDDNPFDLSDGVRWYYLDAIEERLGAPTTPGVAKSTVITTNVDARGSIRIGGGNSKLGGLRGDDDALKHLSKSLDSRRSSTASRRSGQFPGAAALALLGKPGSGSSDGLRDDTHQKHHHHVPLSGSPKRVTHRRTGSQTSSLRNAYVPANGDTDGGAARGGGEEIAGAHMSTCAIEGEVGETPSRPKKSIEEVRIDQLLGP